MHPHRLLIIGSLLLISFVIGAVIWWHPGMTWLVVLVAPCWVVAIYDMFQTRHSIMRNYPLVGRLRWLMEDFRPFVQQYFIESELDGRPISRMFRSIVYQRAKNAVDTVPFGTKIDVRHDGYEWIGHSINAIAPQENQYSMRVNIGGPGCKHPYSASVLNISAMSFGALSQNAIMALNRGAQEGKFYHNTGEGGISPYHLKYGGDLVWQIGSGYFGCRTDDGKFDPDAFQKNAQKPSVKMIEIKLSQGAKPGHGGILPAHKNSEEIARIRLVEPHTEVQSPPAHSAFDTPIGLLQFITQLRELSGGKPIGFKLCIGRKSEFIAICKAMLETGIQPDFITVDGGEGGTGAAPLEYTNSIGMPLREAIVFVDDILRGYQLRDDIKIIASGKIFTAFHITKAIALGADLCNSARGMMLAIGCVQSLQCNTNRCPTGVATQDPSLYKGLVVEDKYQRVKSFHAKTIHATLDLISSAGETHLNDIYRQHIFSRVNHESVKRLDEVYPIVDKGAFLEGNIPTRYATDMREANAKSFKMHPQVATT
ncbi:FMN-binding glutamate synthase family protein [Aestuariibacter sp. AA17]|uniref:FMN-binding glutamate synthase family protein n=1 Tax=Fluctibacter corallii TaxID=2984329 RepID=A0ABT3A7R8_9ALTE|nr:FMN-binding glutamate synthase family protein [Aestuariibacter sp. AA17]MCV2884730.1 FMN-binding glutamate synthase family protein [Aestuariibacter sp. AA17]